MVNGYVYEDIPDGLWGNQPFAGAGTIEAPVKQERTGTDRDKGWFVTIYNNDYNTYEEVMTILMIATNCDADEAYMETWEVDHLGQSVVYCGSEEDCKRAAEIISTIGMKVTVTKDE